MKRIGVLTGGGDVPGLNPCIKTIANRAIDEGYEVIGIRKGWGGLLNYNLDDPATHAEYIVPLDRQRVRTVCRSSCKVPPRRAKTTKARSILRRTYCGCSTSWASTR